MQINMDYGRSGLTLDVPDNADVFLVRGTPSLAGESAAIREALRHPIECPPLKALVKKGMQVLIVHTDITRATPNDRLLPVILDELENAGVRKQDITLMNALGTHRPQTGSELERMLGRAITGQYKCRQHDAFDNAGLVSLGTTHRGHPILLNQALMQADLTILTGFIEPHFFAGYSGGPKAVLPGLAGAASIFANHGPEMIAQPGSTFNVTTGNPILEEIQEVALKVKNTFLVNVTLNRAGEITGIFTGDLTAAHAEGCRFVQQSSVFTINAPYDVVVTSNSGYPLDQNLYQCVKGMAAAGQAVRKGGAILMVAACEEGLPDHGSYADLLKQAGSVEALLRLFSSPDIAGQDSWQVQIQAQVQQQADVYFYSDGLSDTQINASLLNPCRDLLVTMEKLVKTYGQRVCVLPQGPLTILEVDQQAM